MGAPFPYPTQTIPDLPPADPLTGDEEVWANQAGEDVRVAMNDIVAIAWIAGGSTTVPLIDADTGAIGVGTTWARGDHVHPMPRLDQVQAPASSFSLAGNSLLGVGTPVNASDAATKGYVDALIQGMSLKPTANYATTAALPANTYNNGVSGVGAKLTATANAALSIDGSAVAAGQVLLIKNEANGANNGLYDVTQPGSGTTPYILTRDASMDLSSELSGALVSVSHGVANANSLWLANPSLPATIGTTAIPWTQLNAQTAIIAGNGINVVANTISAVGVAGQIQVTAAGIGIDPAYVGQASITTVGALVAPSLTGATAGAILDSFVIDAGTF
jgi:hypothetical protein